MSAMNNPQQVATCWKKNSARQKLAKLLDVDWKLRKNWTSVKSSESKTLKTFGSVHAS